MNRPRPFSRGFTGLHPAEIMLGGIPLLVALIQGYRQRWVAEDAFISLRAVENLLAGHGPVFNIGERVEVYTHPLWFLMISVAGALGFQSEYVAVYLGLFLSLAGIAMAQLGAARLSLHLHEDRDSRRTILLPIGMLVFVSIPVVWDFMTSGLETGLTFAWLGVSFWLLVCHTTRIERADRSRALPLIAAVVFGSGPLVRPDLGLFAVLFLLALVTSEVAGQGWRRAMLDTIRLGLGFGAVLCIYQVFRMGYFATLVPNTALAKEAGSANWDRGWTYFTDFSNTYHLWLPLIILFTGWVILLSTMRKQRWRAALAVTVPVLAAILHGLYVVWIGGDFMHGRLLLPALFGVLLPLAVVAVEIPDRLSASAVLTWTGIGVVAIWAVCCTLLFRWSIDETAIRDGIPQGIVNERQFFVEQTGSSHPITVDDYRGTTFDWVEHGLAMRLLAASYPRLVLTDYGDHPLDGDVDDRVALVAYAWSIGVQSHAAGDSVRLVDLLGLGDPLASRMQIVGAEGRPGHEKQLPLVWIHARYADVSAIDPLPADLRAAADVLQCGDVRELLRAVEEPLTLQRFASNIRLSWSLTRLRIHPDPFIARQQICSLPP